jgi:hypothetical protein
VKLLFVTQKAGGHQQGGDIGINITMIPPKAFPMRQDYANNDSIEPSMIRCRTGSECGLDSKLCRTVLFFAPPTTTTMIEVS